MTINNCLWDHKNYLIILIAPFVILPLPLLVEGQKGTCGFMLLLMGVYWCTEALPLAITGMIPVFLAPMFGILTTAEVCFNYLKDNTMMFTGGLIVAITIEHSNLHRRIALTVLRIIGTSPQWLMFGFMLPTWFLSMWISNTATTAMMLPIMEAVLEQINNNSVEDNENDEPVEEYGNYNEAMEMEPTTKEDSSQPNGNVVHCNGTSDKTSTFVSKQYINNDGHISEKNESSFNLQTEDSQNTEDDSNKNQGSQEYVNFCKAMTIAVAYAANVGGTATLTGTGPNTIMKDQADEQWRQRGFVESPVTYTSWLIYGFPIALLNFFIVYLWLLVFFLGRRAFQCEKEDPEKSQKVKEVILTEYKALGDMTFHEAAAGTMFVILVLLWFFRAPGFMPGWSDLFEPGYIGDAVPAIFIAVLLFAIPKEFPRCNKVEDRGPAQPLVTWQTIHQKYPWSIIFLMGGGFALAESCEVSGLSAWIGEQLAVFGSLPGWLMVSIICIIVAMLTEVTSNSATCTILMPIVAAMAESLGKNPLYLMFPTAIATSYAFMLPVATPPNAIAFSYGRITVMDLVKAGAVLNFACIFSVVLANETWGMAFFNLDEMPWGPDNTTTTAIYDNTTKPIICY